MAKAKWQWHGQNRSLQGIHYGGEESVSFVALIHVEELGFKSVIMERGDP